MPEETKRPQISVKLGVSFDLNGQPITLHPKESIDQIKEKGIDLSLPSPLPLGTVATGIDGILQQLGSDKTVAEIKNSLPDFQPLTDVYDKVSTANLNVEKFHAKIPGSIDKNQGIDYKLYTVGLSATWKLKGNETGLTLTGIYFEVSNEELPAITETK